tara:strand:+ start:33 stop:206 length:174 start_codon:yes stop_codon:yes gene_type:complete
MISTYTTQRIADTENGWLLIHNETGKKDLVFCRLDANTAEDAVAVLESLNVAAESDS